MTFEMADLFCGAGGTSSGAIQALEMLGIKHHLTAVNHWDVAVSTHQANHPNARHFCASVDSLNPRQLFDNKHLNLLWASPECTHHSIARGGAPVNDQSRATAWCVTRWAEALQPDIVLVENVPEFESWGPVTKGRKPRPIPSKKGQIFRAWINAMVALGYRVDHTILCAADFGDPTTRRRLFVQFVRGRRKIVWPTPTHGNAGDDLFGARLPWKPVRGVIDWQNKGKSIYNRKKSLADTTMQRIYAGLQKYGLRPFILGQQTCSAPRSVDEPLPTISTAGAISLTECIVEYNKDSAGKERVRGIDEPLPTIDCSNRFGLAQPYLIELRGTTLQQCEATARTLDAPLGTITSGNHFCLCEPHIVSFYGNGGVASIDNPLPTITCKDRFGLAQPVIVIDGREYKIDILFRMLAPNELAKAMGFPETYQFKGTKTEIIKQVGNAVPRGLSCALVAASVSQNADAMRKAYGLCV